MSIWKKLPVVGGIIDSAVGVADSYFNRQMQKDAMHNSISYRVADAKRAGIHPLAALGASTFSPRPIQTGTDFEGIGQSLSKISPANTSQEKIRRSLENEYNQEKIKNLKAQTAYTMALATGTNNNSVSSSGDAPISGISGQDSSRLDVDYIKPQVKQSQSIGTESGIHPIELYGVTKHGTLYRVPGSELQEGISEGSFFTQAKYNLGQLVDYIKGYQTYLFPAVESKYRKILSKERAGIMKYVNPGYEARYNILRGSWVIRKKGGKSKFWDHSKMYNVGKNIKQHKTPKGEHKLWNY